MGKGICINIGLIVDKNGQKNDGDMLTTDVSRGRAKGEGEQRGRRTF